MADPKEVSFTIRVKDAASAALKQIEETSGKTFEKLFSFKDILKEISLAVGAFSLVEIVKDMVDLGVATDKTFRQIASNLPTAAEGMHELKESISALAVESGRSLEEMHAGALQISKLGVSSAEDLKQQLSAATLLADATSSSLPNSIDLLQQLRREFGLTGEQAMKTAADLASAARGRVNIDELFATFQRSAPIFQKFNIDAATATRAIVYLVESGVSAKQVGKLVTDSDAERIKTWASHIKLSADSLGELQERANSVRAATQNVATAVRAEFSDALEDLGTKTLPMVTAAMNGLLSVMGAFNKTLKDTNADAIPGLVNMIGRVGHGAVSQGAKDAALGDLRRAVGEIIGGAGIASNVTPEFLKGLSTKDIASALIGLQSLADHAQLTGVQFDTARANIKAMNDELATRTPKEGTRSGDSARGKPDLGLGESDKKKIEEAARKLRELKLEFDSLASTSDQGKLKSEQFAEAVARYAEKARDAKMPAGQLAAELEKLGSVQAKIHQDELAAAQDFGIGIEQSLGAASGHLAGAAATAISARAEKLKREIELNKLLTDEQKKRFTQDVEQTKQIELAQNRAKPDIDRTRDTIASVGGEGHTPLGDTTALNTRQLELLAHQREIVAVGGDDKEIRAELLEIDKKRAEILKGLIDPAKQAVDLDREHTQQVRDQANAIAEAVSGAIQLGQALHATSGGTAQTLHAILGVATGVAPLLDSIQNLDKTDVKTGKPKADAATVAAAARPVVDGLIALTGQQHTKLGASIGGAASGASTGAEIGSLIPGFGTAAGAVVGGLTGMVSGLLGARKAAEEAAKAMQMIKDQTAATLADWRAQITGTMADQKAAALLDLRVKYDNIIQTIEQTEAGKKMEEQRNKDLADAKALYEKNKAALEANTAAILESANVINNVNGYKLNLQLYNFSPAYGPQGTPAPTPPASGSGGSSSGGSGSSSGNGDSGGGGTVTDSSMNVILNVDGAQLARVTLKQFQKRSQAAFGTTDKWAQVTEV